MDWDAETTFIPLADYQQPSMPVEETFRRVLGRVHALMSRNKPTPFIADARLKKATIDTLDHVVAPPACGPLLEEMDRTVAAWRGMSPKPSHMLAVVLPPCEQNAVVETWAHQHGHQVASPPPRDALVEGEAPLLPDMEGGGLLVVPRLEHWMLRHRRGLRSIRTLLERLDRTDRPIVIGCNSWAWTFLAKAVAADQLLPDPMTFKAFDAPRLQNWFADLATTEATEAVRFRLPANGADVLATGEDGRLANDYLRTLAGRSLGIPWVAWHLWRRSLRSERDDAVAADVKASLPGNDDAEPGEQTLWIAALDEYVLPGAKEQMPLLVLQALLIHGPLSPGQLRLVLPMVGESNLVPVLVKAGFLSRAGGLVSCNPAAYPAIRAGLATAGLPLDGI